MCQFENMNREELVKHFVQAVQDSGNANILLVNAIGQRIGLSATEFEALSVVKDHGPMTAGDLAKRCGITSGGLTGLVDRLARMNFVRREPDENDRRKVLISMQPRPEIGKKVRAMYAPLTKIFEEHLAKLTDDQLRAMLEFHLAMNDAMVKATEQLAKSD